MRHEIKSNTITNGNMNAIHSPKSIPKFSPSGLLSACKAIALGGVPMGVAIPPRLAATGILSVSAIRPLPDAGRAANTGVRKVNIMAAVAVLLTNIEKTPVMSKKPNKTFSLFFPKGFIRFFANNTSNPDFVAAIAKIKPPKKSMITGLAKVAMISFDLSSVPKTSFSSPLKKAKLLLETVRHITVMIAKDVAQDGMASVIHDKVAKTKMAMIRCWTMVSPSIPKMSVGRFQTMAVSIIMQMNSMRFFLLN